MTRGAARAVMRVVPPPDDAPRRWPGILDAGLEPLRVARYGDCTWREVDGGHGRGRRPGYPLAAAEQLARHGIGMRFSDVWVPSYGHLPRTREELVRHLSLGGDPDAVLVQLGHSHATRALLPTSAPWIRLRELGAHRPPRLARAMYAASDPLLRRFGRVLYPEPPDGSDCLAAFFALVRGTWPRARVLVMAPPSVPLRPGYCDPVLSEQAWRTAIAAARAAGVDTLDLRPEVGELQRRLGRWRVTGANGVDTRRPGSELVGRRLAEWLLAARAGRAGQARAGAPTSAG